MNSLNKIKLRTWLIVLGLLILASAPAVLAQTDNDVENLTAFRLLREFSFFLNIVLIVLVILLIVSLNGALKYLNSQDTFKNKVKLAFSFLRHEPAQVFSQQASKEPNGTFKMPFEKYRKIHLFTRKTFLRTMGLVVLQVIVIVFMIYGITLLAHYSNANGGILMQSRNFFLQLNK